MRARLMDVYNKYGKIMHAFPVELAEEGNDDEETAYHEKALQAAFAHLVPDEELQTMTARNHVSRAGLLEPYGDRLAVNSETRDALEQEIREQAYLLLERNGRPEGCDEYYWECAAKITSKSALTYYGNKMAAVKDMQMRTGNKCVSSRSSDIALKQYKNLQPAARFARIKVLK